jgi:hypothetical protein
MRMAFIGLVAGLLLALFSAGGSVLAASNWDKTSTSACFDFPGQHICDTLTVETHTVTTPSGVVIVQARAGQTLTGNFADCSFSSRLQQRNFEMQAGGNIVVLVDHFTESSLSTCGPGLNCTVTNELHFANNSVQFNRSSLTCS